MEIKAKLLKPYTEDERLSFIVEQNHQNGYEIKETETELQALGYTKEELAQLEKERISRLYLTRSDVERAIYKVKKMDFIDILKLIETQHKEVDLKALKIELGANNFYRANPYVEQVGLLLGFSSIQLDRFFETGDYKELETVEPKEEKPKTKK